MKTITIDPITRLEGHGKIDIFLTHQVLLQKYAVFARVVITWHQVRPLTLFLGLSPLPLQK
jgi:coenzyme F420-reducing hydrogenase alpha subunit